ncbi:MAG: RES family NAD+ phosphorylase [Candidatus Sulfotelmatobacter sp.]
MTRLYRILRKAYANAPFDGEGAYRYGGRWSSSGTRLSYTSEHQSLAMLEYFVHLDPGDPPEDLLLASADVPDSTTRERIPLAALPPNWRATPAPAALARFGDQFVEKGKSCVLVVPSALSPRENNWLLNPRHSDFAKIVILPAEPLSYDPRMFVRRRQKNRVI